jgi:phosphoglycerate dehydrogenase-like enzyme
MRTLLISAPMPESYFRDAILAADPAIELLEHGHKPGDDELAHVEAVLAWRLPPKLLVRLPRLKWVCAVAAGVDKLLVPELPAHVVVSRIIDPAQAQGLAQFVMLMALRHARGLPAYEAQQRRHEWIRHPVDVVRSRVAVLGTGAMGGAVLALLEAAGFDVHGWNRRSTRSLADQLGDADIVVNALPLTSATRALFDANTFASMKMGAYFINIARGEHVVEADLIAALRTGHLSGAALDVQCREPLPADDPLWDAPHVTITPHIGAQPTPETIAAQFVAGMQRWKRGEPPLHVVDRSRGY